MMFIVFGLIADCHIKKQPMVHALVPIKSLTEAKTRLAPLLSPTDRVELALAMLADVLNALTATIVIGKISVISSDKQAATVAQQFGTELIRDNGELNAALTRAATACFNADARPLIVFADLPLATPAEFSQLVGYGNVADVVLARAADNGTNAMLTAPGFPLLFGSNSLVRHLHTAEQLGLHARVVDLSGLSRDIDQPADLWWLAERGATTQAGRFAKTMLARL